MVIPLYCGHNCPVEYVSWNDIQSFIDTLNAMGEGSYTFLTEAQWEYASRAGSDKAFTNGDVSNITADSNLDVVGWYSNNSNSSTNTVAQKQPNALGIYDMHGNVWEWCLDLHGVYPTNSVTDPTGASSGSDRIQRGGSWANDARYCRSAFRAYGDPSYRHQYFGVRLRLLNTP